MQRPLSDRCAPTPRTWDADGIMTAGEAGTIMRASQSSAKYPCQGRRGGNLCSNRINKATGEVGMVTQVHPVARHTGVQHA